MLDLFMIFRDLHQANVTFENRKKCLTLTVPCRMSPSSVLVSSFLCFIHSNFFVLRALKWLALALLSEVDQRLQQEFTKESRTSRKFSL